MKNKISALVLVLGFSVSFFCLTASDETTGRKTPIKGMVARMTERQIAFRIEEIRQRLRQIKALDKSTLTRENRKEFRKELKTMKKEARRVHHKGAYLSIVAVLIVILVLILFL